MELSMREDELEASNKGLTAKLAAATESMSSLISSEESTRETLGLQLEESQDKVEYLRRRVEELEAEVSANSNQSSSEEIVRLRGVISSQLTESQSTKELYSLEVSELKQKCELLRMPCYRKN